MIFLLQVWAMKFTEATNVWYISVRATYTIKLNIKKILHGRPGFCANVYVVNGLQLENNRPIT